MNNFVNRRQFLKTLSSGALSAALLESSVLKNSEKLSVSPILGKFSGNLKKAACIGVLPRKLSVLERFQLAKKVGFEGIEPNTIRTPEEVQEYKEAAQITGVKIHSIMNSDHWRYSLTDNDPGVVKKSMDGIITSMHNAHDLGADTILLVPGIVTPEVRYVDVYKRSQKQIMELLPLAKELNVIIAIENVENKFLLSPLEFARYIDEINSPYLKGYYDVGNYANIAFVPDWIRTLGKRNVKIHIKRFEPPREQQQPEQQQKRSSAWQTEVIDWPDFRLALSEIGYNGWVTAEVRSGDEEYLIELSRRMDKIFAGESPI
jgi:hexulose-6-phosphate isomerase